MYQELVILSPHLDDAALSLADHILDWQKKHTVHILTVFTSFACSHLSTDAEVNLMNSGARDQFELEEMRKNEDRQAMKLLHMEKNFQYLDFVDAGFREVGKKTLYSSFNNLFLGSIQDSPAYLSLVEKELRKHIPSTAIVVLPLGVGKHVDHLIVRTVAEKIVSPQKRWYYAEYPYASSLSKWNLATFWQASISRNSSKYFSSKKYLILKSYRSQMPILFSKKTSYKEQVYW